jgi:hypothetical protein
MPKRLPGRCQPDSIREFRFVAMPRYQDALSMAAAGRRLGAIYLWGYSAEMLLKAVYFSLIGLGESVPITWPGHLHPAINKGQKTYSIPWPKGNGHNVRAWADLLIAEHAANPGMAYASPFDTELQRRGQRIGQLWNETLRYHKNFAYAHEVRQMRKAVEWLLANDAQLLYGTLGLTSRLKREPDF